MALEDDDLKIVEDKSIWEQVARQGVRNSQISVLLACVVVLSYAGLGGIIMTVAFAHGHEPPSWATAAASSTITAALAIIFKDHLPGPPGASSSS